MARSWWVVGLWAALALGFSAPGTGGEAAAASPEGGMSAMGKSLRDFGVLPTNSAAVNKANLQKAIDWAAARGAALFVEPTDEPYPVDGGLVLWGAAPSIRRSRSRSGASSGSRTIESRF
jgi:hypothetical protein